MSEHTKKKEVKMHVTLAQVRTPPHSYVEEIRTPRGSTRGKECKTPEDWDAQRHAHVDDDTASPHGLVPRVQTPLHTPKRVEGEWTSGSDGDKKDPRTQTLPPSLPQACDRRCPVPAILITVAIAAMVYVVWFRKSK